MSARTRKNKKSKQINSELKELQEIKRLLVLLLMKSDVKADSIAKLLNMDKGNFSKIFPAKELLK